MSEILFGLGESLINMSVLEVSDAFILIQPSTGEITECVLPSRVKKNLLTNSLLPASLMTCAAGGLRCRRRAAAASCSRQAEVYSLEKRLSDAVNLLLYSVLSVEPGIQSFN